MSLDAQMPEAEPGFRESVNAMFEKAAALTDISPGLIDKIRICN